MKRMILFMLMLLPLCAGAASLPIQRNDFTTTSNLTFAIITNVAAAQGAAATNFTVAQATASTNFTIAQANASTNFSIANGIVVSNGAVAVAVAQAAASTNFTVAQTAASTNFTVAQAAAATNHTDAATNATFTYVRAQGTIESNGVVAYVNLLKTNSMWLPVQSCKLPTNSAARIDATENNWRLLFDGTNFQSALWQFVMPSDFGSAGFLNILYSMKTSNTGTLLFSGEVMATTPGDAADINTDGYDATNRIAGTVPATAGYMANLSMTLTNIDGAIPGDLIKVRLGRMPGDAGDTAGDDAEVVGLQFYYLKP